VSKTIKCRIAVIIDHEGNWQAEGWSGSGGVEQFFQNILDITNTDQISDSHSRVIVECELPVPETVVVQGKATEAPTP
jgi:hypothetical protein